MSDDLAPVIEAIGQLWDADKKISWQIAEMVHDAYAEFEHHKQGLSAGLQARLGKTSTQIYSYRDAWQMRTDLFNDYGLSVSHLARAFGLQKTYGLDIIGIEEYLQFAAADGWSVRQLAQEVAGNHEPNPDEAYQRKFARFVKLMRSVWNDPQFGNVNDMIRANYYDLMQELEKI